LLHAHLIDTEVCFFDEQRTVYAEIHKFASELFVRRFITEKTFVTAVDLLKEDLIADQREGFLKSTSKEKGGLEIRRKKM
jgi:hypothetical protein